MGQPEKIPDFVLSYSTELGEVNREIEALEGLYDRLEEQLQQKRLNALEPLQDRASAIEEKLVGWAATENIESTVDLGYTKIVYSSGARKSVKELENFDIDVLVESRPSVVRVKRSVDKKAVAEQIKQGELITDQGGQVIDPESGEVLHLSFCGSQPKWVVHSK